MKLMLPPVVSSGQYQIMESIIAMVEHIAMTDKAMIGPQWHNLRTSWRFSNVTMVDRKFIFLKQEVQEYYFDFQVPEMYWSKFNVLLFSSATLQSQKCPKRTCFVSSEYPETVQALSHLDSLHPINPRPGECQHHFHPTSEGHYPCESLTFLIYKKSNKPKNIQFMF